MEMGMAITMIRGSRTKFLNIFVQITFMVEKKVIQMVGY